MLNDTTTLKSGAKVATGSSITITLTPSSGEYEVGTLKINNQTKELTDGKYTVSNVLEDLTIVATFKAKSTGNATPAAITLKACEKTSNTVSGSAIYTFKLKVDSVEWATVTVTVASGSALNSITSNDVTVTPAVSVTVTEPTALDMSAYADIDKDVIIDKIKTVFTAIADVKRSNVH